MKRVYIGLENINPDSLAGAHKRQNKITEYRKMLQAWKKARIITYCGYILGFPNDTPESIQGGAISKSPSSAVCKPPLLVKQQRSCADKGVPNSRLRQGFGVPREFGNEGAERIVA